MRPTRHRTRTSLSLGTILIVAAVILAAVFALQHCTASNSAGTMATDGDTIIHTTLSTTAPDDNIQLTSTDVLALTSPVTNPALSSQIIDYTGFRLSFNASRHIPNWVAWQLTREKTKGTHPKAKKFLNDPEVEGCPEHYDYSYSGYDRGHMAPAADMKWSPDAMHDCYYLTNICPQTKPLNTGAWKALEEKCRKWATIDGEIIIICGPVLTDTIREYIGDSRIAVPKRFFKVIYSPSHRKGIGFIMPNDRVEGGMQQSAVTIDQVEAITGHDFFASLPDDIENDIESQCDFHYWTTHRK